MFDRPDHRTDDDTADRRRGSYPLVWLLVLIALLAFGWSCYNRRAGQATPAMIRVDTSAPAGKRTSPATSSPAAEQKPARP